MKHKRISQKVFSCQYCTLDNKFALNKLDSAFCECCGKADTETHELIKAEIKQAFAKRAVAEAKKAEAGRKNKKAQKDDHPKDAKVRIAYLPDPVKYPAGKKPGSSVEDRIGASKMQFDYITTQDLKNGILTRDRFDVLCLPGGYAPNYYNEFGVVGRKAVKDFVAAGGGYVGICAGAYFGSHCGCGIGLIDCEVVDIEHWNRGSTKKCELEYTEEAQSVLKSEEATGTTKVAYNCGPMLKAGKKALALRKFVTELRGKCGTYPKTMAGSAETVIGEHGRGRVVLISAHAETMDNLGAPHRMFRQMFRYAAGILE